MGTIIVHSKVGKNYIADDSPLMSGAEGEVYQVIDNPGLLIKMFFPNNRTLFRENKITYLTQHKPDEALLSKAAWPLEVIYLDNKFVGFLMKRIIGNNLEILCLETFNTAKYPQFASFERTKVESIDKRILICFNIADLVAGIHLLKDYTIVDLKPENFLFDANGNVYLLDIDSFQIYNPENNAIYKGLVNTLEYTPPEYYSLTNAENTFFSSNWDLFGMAVIFYRILIGIHPYTASAHKSPYNSLSILHELIEHQLFVHGIKREYCGVIPLIHQNFYNLDDSIQELFRTAFGQMTDSILDRPTALEWSEALKSDHHSFDLKFDSTFSYQINKMKDKIYLTYYSNDVIAVLVNAEFVLPPDGQIILQQLTPSIKVVICDVYNQQKELLIENTFYSEDELPQIKFVPFKNINEERFKFLISPLALLLFFILMVILLKDAIIIPIFLVVYYFRYLYKYSKARYKKFLGATNLLHSVKTYQLNKSKNKKINKLVDFKPLYLSKRLLKNTLNNLSSFFELNKDSLNPINNYIMTLKRYNQLRQDLNDLIRKKNNVIKNYQNSVLEQVKADIFKDYFIRRLTIKGLSSSDLKNIFESGLSHIDEISQVLIKEKSIYLKNGSYLEIFGIGPVKLKIIQSIKEQFDSKYYYSIHYDTGDISNILELKELNQLIDKLEKDKQMAKKELNKLKAILISREPNFSNKLHEFYLTKEYKSIEDCFKLNIIELLNIDLQVKRNMVVMNHVTNQLKPWAHINAYSYPFYYLTNKLQPRKIK